MEIKEFVGYFNKKKDNVKSKITKDNKKEKPTNKEAGKEVKK